MMELCAGVMVRLMREWVYERACERGFRAHWWHAGPIESIYLELVLSRNSDQLRSVSWYLQPHTPLARLPPVQEAAPEAPWGECSVLSLQGESAHSWARASNRSGQGGAWGGVVVHGEGRGGCGGYRVFF